MGSGSKKFEERVKDFLRKVFADNPDKLQQFGMFSGKGHNKWDILAVVEFLAYIKAVR